jgi:hypothetical protein
LAFKEGAMTPCAPLYRRIPDGSGRTSWNGSWVRQSRHFALEDAPGVQNCHTHVRDRWELTAKGGVSPYAFDEDIPTFALDPKTQTLEPALGRLTRWLNWDQKAMDLNQPPDVHEHHRHGNTLRMGLLGGSGRGWFVKPGPIRYDPVRHEVTMGATSGPQPPSGANIFVPAHNSGPASVAQQLARQNQIEQDIAQRSAASTAWAQQQSAMGARSCLQAQQDGVAAQRARMDQQIKAQNQSRMQQHLEDSQILVAHQAQTDADNKAFNEAVRKAEYDAAMAVPDVDGEEIYENDARRREAADKAREMMLAQSEPSVLRKAWNGFLNIGQAVGEWVERNENQGFGLGRVTESEVPGKLAELAKENPEKASHIQMMKRIINTTPFPMGGGLKIVGTARIAPATADFFAGTRYSPKVMDQMKLGEFHAFPEHVTAFQDAGQVTKFTGGDGIVRDMLKIPGEYRGRAGVFEFIKEADGQISHRMFKPN